MPSLPVTIIRSARRKRSVSARVRGDALEVLAPSHISDEELAPIIQNLKQRLARRQAPKDDTQLQGLAERLNQTYFKNQLNWQSIRWSTRQNKRWGSCSPSTGRILINDQLAKMPSYVLEAVVMHELCHLLEANHSKNFWALANRYPKTERARGFLEAVAIGQAGEMAGSEGAHTEDEPECLS